MNASELLKMKRLRTIYLTSILGIIIAVMAMVATLH